MSKTSWLIVITSSDHSAGLFLSHTAANRAIELVNYRDMPKIDKLYDIVYLRDPFTDVWVMTTLRSVDDFTERHPNAYYVDKVKTSDDLLIEDKWRQYLQLSAYMPHTQLLSEVKELPVQPIIKKRISARARDVYFDPDDVQGDRADYITQPLIAIIEEYRVYTLGGEVLPQMVRRSSKTPTSKIKAVEAVPLSALVGDFCKNILKNLPGYDLLGFDVAITSEGPILIEVNRSPQFARFMEMTGCDIAGQLIDSVERGIDFMHQK